VVDCCCWHCLDITLTERPYSCHTQWLYLAAKGSETELCSCTRGTWHGLVGPARTTVFIDVSRYATNPGVRQSCGRPGAKGHVLASRRGIKCSGTVNMAPAILPSEYPHPATIGLRDFMVGWHDMSRRFAHPYCPGGGGHLASDRRPTQPVCWLTVSVDNREAGGAPRESTWPPPLDPSRRSSAELVPATLGWPDLSRPAPSLYGLRHQSLIH
jgi:hypothetical protein